MKNTDKVKRLTTAALTVAVALMLSYIESFIPSPGVPGMKLGLANIAVVFTLYKLGAPDAAAVSGVRILLSALLFGSIASLLYSASGALLSLAVMTLLKKSDVFSVCGVSIAGGVAHNIGQILCAVAVSNTPELYYYLPALIASGVATGAVIGVAGGLLYKKIRI